MKSLTIIYRNIDGCHVLTSDDVDGLNAMHRDFQEALASALEATPILLKDNKGLDLKVEWDASVNASRIQTRETPDYDQPGTGERLQMNIVP